MRSPFTFVSHHKGGSSTPKQKEPSDHAAKTRFLDPPVTTQELVRISDILAYHQTEGSQSLAVKHEESLTATWNDWRMRKLDGDKSFATKRFTHICELRDDRGEAFDSIPTQDVRELRSSNWNSE